ncbi:hypothetical protein BH09VER1_BH09VER1_45710 [soil metagenome]
MGKQYTAIMPGGTERFAADFSMGRAALFYDIALLLERHVHLPCGIAPDPGDEEHRIDVSLFVPFFERVWSEGWLVDVQGGFLSGWAAYAAGIIENATLQSRTWTDRYGIQLSVRRYQKPDEFQATP